MRKPKRPNQRAPMRESNPDREIVITDPAELADVYEGIANRIAAVDLTDTYQNKIFPAIAKAEQGYFDREEDPNGVAWAEWYFRSLTGPAQHKTLHVTGALEESLTGQGAGHVESAGPREATYGTAVPYSAQNQEGGEFPVDDILVGRQHEMKLPGATINIPARPHVGVSEELLETIVSEIADAVILQI